MELRNTLGGGKMQESGNAEGAGKRKCGRSGNAVMNRGALCAPKDAFPFIFAFTKL